MGIDRLDLQAACEIRDIDADGDHELSYRRTYVVADDGKHTEFSDPQSMILEYSVGDPPPAPSGSVGNVSGIAPNDPRYVPPPERKPATLRPTNLILADGQMMPIRPSLPVLLFPGDLAFGDFQSIRRGADWSAYNSPPKGGGHIITLGEAGISPYELVGSNGLRNPALAMRLVGDSVEFEASVFARLSEDTRTEMCQDGSYSFLIWIDRDLQADFGDPECSADDHVYHIRRDSAGSHCTVTTYNVLNIKGNFTLSEASRRIGEWQSPQSGGDHWPHLFHWKLSKSEYGLMKSTQGVFACGLAVEMVCSSGFDPSTFDYKSGGLSYPVGFNRTDPRTWGTLMIALRGDNTYVE
jgi:hypothetical protein